MLMLNRAYGAGDLSLVYPFARGVAPLAVAVVSITVLGENLSYANQGAVLLIGLGITSLALTQRPTSLIDLRPFLFALATGAFIAAYTIVDGLGARAAGSAHGYMIWLSLVTSTSDCWMRALAAARATSAQLRSGRGLPASLQA